MTVPITARVYLGTPALDAEVILNGDFETAGAGAPDYFADWTEKSGFTIDEGVLVHGGAHAVEMPADAWIRQDGIDYVANHLYRLTFWTRSMDGVNSGEYHVAAYDSLGTYVYPIPLGTMGVPGIVYTQVTAYFRAPQVLPPGPGTQHLDVQFHGGLGGCYVDDVSLMDMNDYDYAELADVFPAVSWDVGLPGTGVLDRVAKTGVLNFTLDNASSNSAGLYGLYSPGHANCLAYFQLGAPVYVTLDDGGGEHTVFNGWIHSISPSSGMYQGATVDVVAHDVMGFLSGMEMPLLAASSNPVGYDIETLIQGVFNELPVNLYASGGVAGSTILPIVYDTDKKGDSVMTFLQKMARHEMGHIYAVYGAGATGGITADGRNARVLNQTPAFTLTDASDQPAQTLDVSYNRGAMINTVQVVIYPYNTDVAATTIIYSIKGTLEFAPGQTRVLDCPFTDPVTGDSIAATDVVNPVTVYEFGATDDFVSDTHHAYLTQDNEVGATWMQCTLTSDPRSPTLYLNDWQIQGRGIYRGDGITLEAVDNASVAINGPKRLKIHLDQISSAVTGQLMADWVLRYVNTDGYAGLEVSFFACANATLVHQAMLAEVSTRFTLAESLTGISADYFINALTFRVVGQFLWVSLKAVPAAMTDGFLILDTGHLDSETDGRLGL